MAFDRLPSISLGDYDRVKVTEMGNIIELLYMSFKNDLPRIKKLDKDHYIILNDRGEQVGEVKEFNHYENRADSVNNLRQTFRKIRNTINANVLNIDCVRFITLTYRQQDGEPMTDTKRLYKDFEHFMKRFSRYCEKQSIERPEYINVVEPQGSGAWHCHVLYFWEKKAPYLPNDLIREMWGQGFVTVRSLRDKVGKACDNVGAYLTAYLGDLDLKAALNARMDITKFEVKTVETEVEGEKQDKHFLKGARLYLYPPGMSIFRCSRGIKRPVETEGTYQTAKRKVSDATLTFQSNLRVGFEDGKTNTISKKYYNTAVKGRQGFSSGFRYDLETGEVLEDVSGVKRVEELPDFGNFLKWSGYVPMPGKDPDCPWPEKG